MKITREMLSWDSYAWRVDVQLPSWQGFQDRSGDYGAQVSDEPGDGTVELYFAPVGREADGVPDAAVGLLQWVVDHEAEVSEALLAHLLSRYPALCRSYDLYGDEREQFMPDVAAPSGFRDLIGLHTVQVHRVVEAGVPYVGYELGCSWDPEHGLGVMMHGTRVVKLGGADSAILLWIAEEDAVQRRARTSQA